jgi:hypothetical protein
MFKCIPLHIEYNRVSWLVKLGSQDITGSWVMISRALFPGIHRQYCPVSVHICLSIAL